MFSIIRRTIVSVVFLMIMPVSVWIFGWNWQPISVEWLKIIYWITETVTQPWGIITHSLLCIWFLWCLRFRLCLTIILFVIFSATILVGQGIKSWIKYNVQEPRPFVIWLEKKYHIPVDIFYDLEHKDCNYLMTTQLIYDDQNVLKFLSDYWQKENEFSFPSGHTMFAVSWTLLGVGLLWPLRRIVTIIVLMIWVIGVMGSRLILGMHWPWDLVVAIIISWLLVIFAIWSIQLLCNILTPSLKNRYFN